MDYEYIKNEFIKLKREELEYIDSVVIISSNKILTEYEKICIYRKLKRYEDELNNIINNLSNKIYDDCKNKEIRRKDLKDMFIEFNLDNNFLSLLKFNNDTDKKYLLEKLGIDYDALRYRISFYDLIHFREYRMINLDLILNNQKLIENSIYIFVGYYDSSEDCYGPLFGNIDDYIYGLYENICSEYGYKKEVSKNMMDKFEKDNIIIYSKRYVNSNEVRKIFKEELLNINNNTIYDCVVNIQRRVDELNYARSPEYKEKMLLEKINKLYMKIKGECIDNELLYSGKFLDIIKETYRLPNNNIVVKEKVIKNKGKNSVIVIAITKNKEYIITIQNRIKDKIIVEFPSGYIEDNEDVLDGAKRELLEETGYISDDLFIIDEVYSSLGIDNSLSYIVIANNCIKNRDINVSDSEFITYDLFSKEELEYLINNNIMNGCMNKLAYYNLVQKCKKINDVNMKIKNK